MNLVMERFIKYKSEMGRIFALFSLTVINGSLLYLIYLYITVACSMKVDNILHIPYEPSGMQLFFYFISFPFFMIIATLSVLHSYYYNLRKSLTSGIVFIWLSYFILILYVDLVVHYPTGNDLLYYGTLTISVIAIFYILYLTYYQVINLNKFQK
ncbi:Uncharacterised protein [Legionella busanensis]|uniref:Transmembrane protein n=2 Tax=Legionella busanensis TaxID=190655 RepID=A0A378KD51_9GAMM|nr:Uncharacterised protein [Legionella busanensis]